MATPVIPVIGTLCSNPGQDTSLVGGCGFESHDREVVVLRVPVVVGISKNNPTDCRQDTRGYAWFIQYYIAGT